MSKMKQFITPELQKFYADNGFVRVPGAFSSEEIDRLKYFIYRVSKKFDPGMSELDGMPEPWNSKEFDDRLVDLRQRDPQAFGAFYDSTQSGVEFVRFVTDAKAAAVAASILQDEPENLSYSGTLLRMDAPKDQRNKLGWHQDSSYFFQNQEGEDGVVLWTALQDTDEALGALHVCPGSHKEGVLPPFDGGGKNDVNASEQRLIPDDKIHHYQEAVAEGKKGDLFVFHMNLFHSSGFNISDRIRFSAICRYHRILSDDFVPFLVEAKPNRHILQRYSSQSAK